MASPEDRLPDRPGGSDPGRGRRLGIDVGSVRIGVATCDPDGILATPVETVAREGDPAAVIASEAEARGVDLIAMGTHGGSGLRHLLMGSTADRVLQHANCPVMTIRHPEE